MGARQEVFVPDIGDFKSVDVIEILVKPGDTVSVEQSLVTLESDKATMEIPSPSAGVVKEVRVKIGDKVSEGSPILVLEAGEGIKTVAASAAAATPATAAAADFFMKARRLCFLVPDFAIMPPVLARQQVRGKRQTATHPLPALCRPCGREP